MPPRVARQHGLHAARCLPKASPRFAQRDARHGLHLRCVRASAIPEGDYWALTVAQLKEELKARNLPTTGRKGILIERLMAREGESNPEDSRSSPREADSSSSSPRFDTPDSGPSAQDSALPSLYSLNRYTISKYLQFLGVDHDPETPKEVLYDLWAAQPDAAAAISATPDHSSFEGWTKKSLSERLQALGVDHDPRAPKGMLYDLLLAQPNAFPEPPPVVENAAPRRLFADTSSSDDDDDDDDDDNGFASRSRSERLRETYGGISTDELLHPSFDPSKLLKKTLRAILADLNVSMSGKPEKSALEDLVRNAVDELSVMSELRGEPALERTTDQQLAAAVKARVAAMSADSARDELLRRGLEYSGNDEQVKERLELVLLMEESSAASESPELAIREKVQAMSFAQLLMETRIRGLATSNHPRAQLEETLMERLLLELRTEQASAARSGEASSSEFDWSDVPDSSSEDDVQPGNGLEPFVTLDSITHLLLEERTARLRVAVVAGGPSEEASVSINSARTIVDMLSTRPQPEQEELLGRVCAAQGFDDFFEAFRQQGVTVDVYYIDRHCQPWAVSSIQLYSNTPADFEFKLPSIARRISDLDELALEIKDQCDVAFPVIHGAFGEDGTLQKVLDAHAVPYVGSAADKSAVAFNKRSCAEQLADEGFPVLQQTYLTRDDFAGESLTEDSQERVFRWAQETNMDPTDSVVVVKPANGGSSVGVSVQRGLTDAVRYAHHLLISSPLCDGVVIEPKVLGGVEFTCCVLQTPAGVVALPPSTIEIVDYEDDILEAEQSLQLDAARRRHGYFEVNDVRLDESADSIFSFSRKYMPSDKVRTHTPAKLPADMIQSIRRSAERAFEVLGLRDFARIDGWLMINPDEYATSILTRHVGTELAGRQLDPGPEDSTPGLNPAEEELPFFTGGDLTDEEVEARGPRYDDADPEDVIWVDSHDRYFLESHLYAALEDEARYLDEVAEVPEPDPLDEAPVAPDRTLAGAPLTIPPRLTQETCAALAPLELTNPEGAVIVFSEVNTISGMEQCSFLFQQAAAVGLTHAATLRHALSGALLRADLPLLPPPRAPAPVDPITASQAAALVADQGLSTADMPPALTASGREPQRVYVLCGGDSSERQVSLASGLNVFLQLRRYPDLEVQLFLLAPQFAGLRERPRRAQLLAKRNDLLALGVAEEDLPEELSVAAIRRPVMRHVPLEQRLVWAVPSALALRRSCEEVVEACELLNSTASTAPHARPPDAADGLDLLQQTMWELARAGVSDVGASLEGVSVPRASATDFEGFAYHAQVNGAVVYNAIHGDVGEDGTLQEYLSHFRIPYTGSSELASSVCMDKLRTAEILEPLSESGVFTIPKYEVTIEDLEDLFDEPEIADAALMAIQQDLQLAEGAAMLIKPTADGCSTGVMRLNEGADLALYATAVVSEWSCIPPESSSGLTHVIQMPATVPASFIVEPFIQTDTIVVDAGSGGGTGAGDQQQRPAKLHHEAESGFVEVTIGVYGPSGEVQAMTPSVTLKTGNVLTLEEKFETGNGINLTPPPPEIVSPEAIQAAQERAELVASALQLSGIARIDAFMRVSDGALYVIEVNTVPGMTPATVLFQQALAEDPPLYPNEFLRMQVLLALSGDKAAVDEAELSTDSASFDDVFYSDADNNDGEEFLDDNELGWSQGMDGVNGADEVEDGGSPGRLRSDDFHDTAR